MTEKNLPPERRLDDGTKAQMRAELTEQVVHDSRPRGRSWLVPVVAAAAMVGVAALGTGLLMNGDDDAPDRTDTIAPAGSGTANDPTTPPLEGERAITETTDGSNPMYEDPVACKAEVPNYLTGATQAASTSYAEGTATLWSKGETWVLCDDWAATSDGGSPTLLGNRGTNDPASKETYSLSENYSMKSDSVAQFVAGGPTLPGVRSISYTFPDGHTEKAEIGKDMWLMTYVPTSGALVDPDKSPTKPVQVEVTLDNGTTSSYALAWGDDTCGQINHGC